MSLIPPRFPLNIYDELLFRFDQPSSPLVQHMEIRVTPQLDEARLQQAILSAAQTHPIMQVAMAAYSESDSQFFWQYSQELQTAPLTVEQVDNEEAIPPMRDTFYSHPMSLLEAPPFRCLLVQRGEEESILMLKVSAVASDSIGMLLFLQTLLQHYENPQTGSPHPDFLAFRQQHVKEHSEGLKVISKLLEALSTTLKPASRIARTGPEDATGVGIAPIVFNTAQTKALGISTEDPRALTNRLFTALHVAVEEWNHSHEQKTGLINFVHPVNTREVPWQQSIASNLSMWVNISSQAKDRANIQSLEALMAEQTGQLVNEGILHLLVELAQELKRLPSWLRQVVPGLLPLTGGRLIGTAVVSTLPVLARLQTPTLSVKEWFFTPPCKMPTGASVGAMLYDHRLHLGLRYHQQQFTEDDAWAFAEVLIDALNKTHH